MTTVAQLVDAMESIAPFALAESWDNVGLLLGGSDDPVSRTLLTIDLTSPVLDEAIALTCDSIVAYHPPIFDPIRRLTDRTSKEAVVLHAARAGISIYSPHTALDAAEGGVNDWIAEAFGSGDVRALQPHPALPETEALKIITFCPAEAIDRLRDALASIGAGRIGNYEQCSFTMDGEGTFRGNADSNPVVGQKEVLERVAERRLEMVCSKASLPLAMETIRQFHPYEEPPVEVHTLAPRPQRSAGAGRRLVLDRPLALEEAVATLRAHLGVEHLSVATPEDEARPLKTIGICAGSGRGLLELAISQGCDTYVTGELGHHDVLAARAAGCRVILAGHTETERGYLPRLRERLIEALPSIAVHVSQKDTAPLLLRQ